MVKLSFDAKLKLESFSREIERLERGIGNLQRMITINANPQLMELLNGISMELNGSRIALGYMLEELSQ